MSTYFPKNSAPARKWHIIDAKDRPLGRLATQVAGLLRGKGKPTFTPYIDGGDYVVVVNAEKVLLTGKKREQKVIYSHSLYPGGLKLAPYSRLMKEQPQRVIEHAISGMLCKNKYRETMLTRLKVYRDETHPHAAQQPQPIQAA